MRFYVLLTIEGQRIGTTPCVGNPASPVWDERFTFDIINGQEPLQVMLANRDIYGSDDILGKTQVSLQELRDQMKHEMWLELQTPSRDPKGSGSLMGSLRIVLQWIFCKEKYFEQAIKRLQQSLDEELRQKTNIYQHYQKFQEPFKNLLGQSNESGSGQAVVQESSEGEQQKLELKALTGDQKAKLVLEEQRMALRFENMATNVAQKIGYETVPWYRLTWIILGIYSFLTILTMFFRADFFNLTICCVTLFMLLDTNLLKKSTFRYLVYATCASFIYDVLWYLTDKPGDDQGLEGGLHRFASFISLLMFRIVVIVVFWRDSVDFKHIIQANRGGGEVRQQAFELAERIAKIDIKIQLKSAQRREV